VADFLVAGRVAGRYVLSVSGMEGELGLIVLVAASEANYQTGFAMSFWGALGVPLMVILSLTGFVTYRFRETKILSMGQFLELRYSRSFRIFAMSLRTFSEMLCNTIGPAVAARFFIYLLGLPHHVMIAGLPVQTFIIVLVSVLILALILILTGGQISIMVTSCLQGLVCYPIFVIFSVFLLTEFSWFGEITPIMLDRVPGESFLNPYDIQNLRDFNLFALIVTLSAQILNRGVWSGGGASTAAKSAHEQKMAGILGAWKNGFAYILTLLIAVCVITFMMHGNFAGKARQVRIELIGMVTDEVTNNKAMTQEMIKTVESVPLQHHEIGMDTPLSRKQNPDTAYLDTVHAKFLTGADSEGEGNAMFQEFRSLYNQMMMPVVFRKIMPPVILSLFVLLGILLMVSTDDSRIFSSASTIVQDLIVPLKKKTFTPEGQVRCIKMMVVFVAICFFFGSIFLSQLDYINLFCQISTSIWIGGAGSVITFGLYSKRGTTAGAFAAIFTGAGISGGGLLIQRLWAADIYPILDNWGWTEPIGNFLESVSAPFHPYVMWSMDPVKFPINSMELFFLAMVFSVAMYWGVSLLTYRRAFNLDRMLHRGIYNIDGENKNIHVRFSWKTLFTYFINITPDYTRGDRIIAWSVFGYTFIYGFGVFLLTVIWNLFSPWPQQWWGYQFFITSLLVPSIAGIISTFWFFIGGVIDLRRLFRDLNHRIEDVNDNGRVEGNVSLADNAVIEITENGGNPKKRNQADINGISKK
jgi:Na+/proline symporter